MVVAVVPVGVMEVPVDEVVDVVAVGHGLVSTAGAVDVTVLVPGAAVCGGAGGRVALAHLDHVLVHVVAVGVVEVAVVEVVHVVAVLDGDVATLGAVDVVVVLVLVAVHVDQMFGRASPTVEWFSKYASFPGARQPRVLLGCVCGRESPGCDVLP